MKLLLFFLNVFCALQVNAGMSLNKNFSCWSKLKAGSQKMVLTKKSAPDVVQAKRSLISSWLKYQVPFQYVYCSAKK